MHGGAERQCPTVAAVGGKYRVAREVQPCRGADVDRFLAVAQVHRTDDFFDLAEPENLVFQHPDAVHLTIVRE